MIDHRTLPRALVVFALGAGHMLAASPASADKPADRSTDKTGDKLDAKSLMQSGLKLYAAKDFLGALAVFRTAYERFPSAKILLNIGTTLTKLDRKAEAANVYQRYLDAADSDPAKQAEVKKVLAQLDAAVATLELAITPGDAEIQINNEDWIASAGTSRHRVNPGPVTVRARGAGYQPGEQSVTTSTGARLLVTITLIEIPAPPPPPVAPAAALPTDNAVVATADTEPPRSRIGVIALAHIDLANRGAAGFVGATVNATDRLQLQAAAILGPSYGGYAGASFAVTGGMLRPLVAAGVPIFVSHGARIGLRGAGGIELAVNRHLAVIAELGVEYLFNPETGIKHTLFIPALGAAGRL
ncbi:MAG: hypothetical protein E6J91_12975 [Deltaproteobacteria bacterium]|nr:MAG: hypothetical protein E6J91_12975 [Deltaproteobacteria bacterium]